MWYVVWLLRSEGNFIHLDEEVMRRKLAQYEYSTVQSVLCACTVPVALSRELSKNLQLFDCPESCIVW